MTVSHVVRDVFKTLSSTAPSSLLGVSRGSGVFFGRKPQRFYKPTLRKRLPTLSFWNDGYWRNVMVSMHPGQRCFHDTVGPETHDATQQRHPANAMRFRRNGPFVPIARAIGPGSVPKQRSKGPMARSFDSHQTTPSNPNDRLVWGS